MASTGRRLSAALLHFCSLNRLRIHVLASVSTFMLMPRRVESRGLLGWPLLLERNRSGLPCSLKGLAGTEHGLIVASTRQIVFAGDRLVAHLDIGSAGYEGKWPMSMHALFRLIAILAQSFY